MIAIIDTNFLARYFIDSKTIGDESKYIFEDENTFLIIPSIVLVELKYSIYRGRFPQKVIEQSLELIKKGNCMVYPLDLDLLDYIPFELDIHDGIIFATAKVQLNNFKEEIYILTKDQEMKNLKHKNIKVVW